MGRKSNKEKRQKRKAELKELKEEDSIMAVKRAIVDAANQIEDPMSMLLPFKKFERNGLSLDISFHRVNDLDDETKKWVFDLTRDNMKVLYEATEWGWKDPQKREEMLEDAACYLIARERESDTPVALVHFRFDMDFDDAVLYCYEIQLEKKVRRKGLGKFMIQILELMAHKTNMEKVMLTVFKDNAESYNFFRKTLKYDIDETSPEESLAEQIFEKEPSYFYEILCKSTQAKRKPLSTHQHHNTRSGAQCCC